MCAMLIFTVLKLENEFMKILDKVQKSIEKLQLSAGVEYSINSLSLLNCKYLPRNFSLCEMSSEDIAATLIRNYDSKVKGKEKSYNEKWIIMNKFRNVNEFSLILSNDDPSELVFL